MKLEEKLIGERIVLEQPKATFEQAKETFALVDLSREELRPWLVWCDKTKVPEDSFGFLKDWCVANREKEEGFAYLIREKETGVFCGTVDIFNLSKDHKSGEIGYWLGTPYVGKGYMQEAVKVLEKEAFAKGLNRIVIHNDVENVRSANVAERAGYHLDGVMRQQKWSDYKNSFVDINVWSKLKDEFESEFQK